jgi:alanine dehydrogenase
MLALANKSPETAMADNPHLAAGLNVQAGEIVHPDVVESLDRLS